MSLPPLGRLDLDSHGLLILSNDGVLAKAVIGPQSELDKEYVVRVAGRIDEETLGWLRHGLSLDGRKLRPAKVEVIQGQVLRFTLTEGRNRQIRRMCELMELRVMDLAARSDRPIGTGRPSRGQMARPDARRTRSHDQGVQGRDTLDQRGPVRGQGDGPVSPGGHLLQDPAGQPLVVLHEAGHGRVVHAAAGSVP